MPKGKRPGSDGKKDSVKKAEVSDEKDPLDGIDEDLLADFSDLDDAVAEEVEKPEPTPDIEEAKSESAEKDKAEKPVEEKPKVDENDCKACAHYTLHSLPSVTGIANDLILVTKRFTRTFCGTRPCDSEKFKGVSPKIDCRDKTFLVAKD